MRQDKSDAFHRLFASMGGKDAGKRSSPGQPAESAKRQQTTFREHTLAASQKRNDHLTTFLERYSNVYVHRLEQKEALKKWFFAITLSLLGLALVGAACFSAYILRKLGTEHFRDGLPALITAIASAMTALLALPTIIANYLFNKEEDKEIVKLLADVFKTDSTDRQHLGDQEFVQLRAEVVQLREETAKK